MASLERQEMDGSGVLPLSSPTIRLPSVERSSDVVSTMAGPSIEVDAFQTPTLGIGAVHEYLTGLDQDAEMYDVGGEDIEDDDSIQVVGVDQLPGVDITKLKSKYWKEYVPIVVGNVVEKGRCKHCDKEISAKPGAGTSSFLKHLKRCKKRSSALKIVEGINSTLRTPDGACLKNWSFDRHLARCELIRMLSLHDIPFTFLEYDGFRRFVGSLNPLFQVVTRTTARNLVMKDFQEHKLTLQEAFKNASCKFSLTADMWTSNQTLGYMCITCHSIDSDWKVQKRVIKFFVVETPHTGVEMFNSILEGIQEWNLEDKLFGITLDNASANDAMVDMLKRNLVDKNALPVKGKLFHNRCAAHVLNIIAREGLKFIDPIIVNIRDSVKYIKSSQSRKQKFEAIVAQEAMDYKNKKRPSLDVPTRWNSTYLMLETALLYRRMFDSLAVQDSKYTLKPSSEEWERATTVCRLLKVFYDATKTISGSKYPTSNLYFNEMWNVKLVLQKEASMVDIDLGRMVEGMRKKFNKYWMKSCTSLSIPVIFDPRFKFKYIEFRFKQAFPSDSDKRLDKVKRLLQGLFDEYTPKFKDDNATSMQEEGGHEICTKENDQFADWDQHLTNEMQVVVSTELDRYLAEIPLQRSEEFDILNWWMVNSTKYPTLARIARDVLAVPASTVASEATFSAGGRIISDFRSRLSGDTVEALICLQDWYRAATGTTKYSLDSIDDLINLED